MIEPEIRKLFDKAHLPKAYRRTFLSIILKHADESINFAALSRFFTSCPQILPPYQMIVRGPGRTWGDYYRDWHNTQYDWEISPQFFDQDPFYREIKRVQIGVRLPDSLRTQGHMIMAPPGHGKTNLMENLIMEDVKTGAAVIVMDSQEGMIDRLLYALPEDRVAYFDGSAMNYPLAISAFNLGRADRVEDEVKLARAMDMFENMFSSMEFKFTMKQSTLFRELCRFLAVIPNSGLDTAIDILQNGYSNYYQYLYKLPHSTGEFITTHVGVVKRGTQSDYTQTRREVETRLRALSTSPAIQRMLNAPEQKVNIAKEINSHKLILINTAQGTLSPSGASLMGRYFLMQIILEVLSRPENNSPIKRICFYIDEAQEYFSNSGLLSLLLEQGRKRGLCITMAFHHLGQLARAGDGLPDVVRSLTAMKTIKAANAADARAVGGDMQADPKLLQSVPRRSFVLHCRDLGHTVYTPPKSDLKPRRDSNELMKMKRRMHKKYGYQPEQRNFRPDEPPKPVHKPKKAGIDPDAEQSLDD